MKKLHFLVMLVTIVTISPGISDAQVSLKKLKDKAQSAVGKEETKEQDQAQKQDVMLTTESESASAAQAVIYVTKSGSNKNDGSLQAPMKNIDKAIDKAAPGTEIRVAEGVYMGTFNIGYLETDKPIKLYGSWDEQFTKQDIVNHPTVFQPDNESGGKSRKALLKFTKEVDGTVVDGIVWDMGERNVYDAEDGVVEGVDGGRMRYSSEPSPPKNSTVEEPAISIASAAQGGDVTIQNCVFVNCSQFAIQAGHRSGSFKVLNNVFVANRMAAIEIYGTCAGSNQKSNMVSCGDVEIAHNTILFTWSRLKDFLDMGYGVRIMTKCTYDIHHNIIGASIMGGIDNSRFCKDEFIRIDHNILFGNKGGDLYYTPASNTKLELTADQFEDLEFESVSGNIGEAPELGVNQAYMKGFFSARYSETTNYDPNSLENQWARALGMNQQGTMSSKVSMFMNKYPWREALTLFGASPTAGAQKPHQ